jgi:hypothetical protein
MPLLRHTLLSDGSTDANLIPIINWTLSTKADVLLATGRWADFWRLPLPPQNFAERIRSAVDLFPCDVLFIHRDAEGEEPRERHAEIRAAVDQARAQGCAVPAVAIVPVRMTEAWLTFSENAIRHAAGNPNGDCPLNLPALNKIERRPDPKSDLQAALIAASGLTGRRRKKFSHSQALRRIVDFIDDFSPLRELSAFRVFEETVGDLKARAWEPGFYGVN